RRRSTPLSSSRPRSSPRTRSSPPAGANRRPRAPPNRPAWSPASSAPASRWPPGCGGAAARPAKPGKGRRAPEGPRPRPGVPSPAAREKGGRAGPPRVPPALLLFPSRPGRSAPELREVAAGVVEVALHRVPLRLGAAGDDLLVLVQGADLVGELLG